MPVEQQHLDDAAKKEGRKEEKKERKEERKKEKEEKEKRERRERKKKMRKCGYRSEIKTKGILCLSNHFQDGPGQKDIKCYW